MARVIWDEINKRYYEGGIDRGMLYPAGQPGVSWSGLLSVGEAPTGGDVKSYYIDGVMYLQAPNADGFEATINAFGYPPEFDQCIGLAQPYPGLFATQQIRKPFGLCY